MISLPLESQAEIRKQVTEQWQALLSNLSTFGVVRGGFRKSEQGLPAGGDEDWFLITFLDIPNYECFRGCVSTIDSPQYRDLRNFCDVRFILGDVAGANASDIREFF